MDEIIGSLIEKLMTDEDFADAVTTDAKKAIEDSSDFDLGFFDVWDLAEEFWEALTNLDFEKLMALCEKAEKMFEDDDQSCSA